MYISALRKPPDPSSDIKINFDTTLIDIFQPCLLLSKMNPNRKIALRAELSKEMGAVQVHLEVGETSAAKAMMSQSKTTAESLLSILDESDPMYPEIKFLVTDITSNYLILQNKLAESIPHCVKALDLFIVCDFFDIKTWLTFFWRALHACWKETWLKQSHYLILSAQIMRERIPFLNIEEKEKKLLMHEMNMTIKIGSVLQKMRLVEEAMHQCLLTDSRFEKLRGLLKILGYDEASMSDELIKFNNLEVPDGDGKWEKVPESAAEVIELIYEIKADKDDIVRASIEFPRLEEDVKFFLSNLPIVDYFLGFLKNLEKK